jgi:hypothetical protein
MPTLQQLSVRVVTAAGFAAAIAVAPAAAVFSGAAPHLAPHAVADSAQCTGGDSMDAFSLACVPDIAPGTGGAPGEMQLTEDNPGLESPSHQGR